MKLLSDLTHRFFFTCIRKICIEMFKTVQLLFFEPTNEKHIQNNIYQWDASFDDIDTILQFLFWGLLIEYVNLTFS